MQKVKTVARDFQIFPTNIITDNLYSLVYAEEEYLLVGYCHADKFRYRYQYLPVAFSLEIQEVILPSRSLSKRHENS